MILLPTALCTLQFLLLVMATHVKNLSMPGKVLPVMMSNMVNIQQTTPLTSPYYSSVPIQLEYHLQPTTSTNYGKARKENKKGVMFKARQTLYKRVPNNHTIHPVNTILVETAPQPTVNIMFRSSSSSVNVLQDHKQTKNVVRQMHTQEEPVRMVLNITKPVIQDVHELILPYRNIKQEIHPVKEYMHTVVKDSHDTHYPEYKHDDIEQEMFPEYFEPEKQAHVDSFNDPSENHKENDGLHKLKSFISYVQGQNKPKMDNFSMDEQMNQSNMKQISQMTINPSTSEYMHSSEKSRDGDHFGGKSEMSDAYSNSNFPLTTYHKHNLDRAINVRVQAKVHKSTTESEYKTRPGHYNGSMEPVFRESQTATYYQQNGPSENNNEQYSSSHNSSTVTYHNDKLYANLTSLNE